VLKEQLTGLSAITSYKYSPAAFAYASCLSTSVDDIELGQAADLFQELADDGYRQRDCYYRAAVCHYKVGRFAASRQAIAMSAELDPKFDKAKEFAQLVADTTRIGSFLGFRVKMQILQFFSSPFSLLSEGHKGIIIAGSIFAFAMLFMTALRSRPNKDQ
jgi:hypothetical protein